MLHVVGNKVEIYFSKIGFIDCKWSNLNTPGSYTPCVIHFWGPLWSALYSAGRKRECCMWLINKVEIYFSKIGFVNCKWSNLNVPGSYTPWLHSLLGSTVGCPFPCMQEKGMVHLAFKKVEIY